LADIGFAVSTDPKTVDIMPHRSVCGEVLSRDHFLTQLHREKRRADRSRAPLSLVVENFAGCDGFDEADVRDIITDLSLSKRETDIVGHLGDGVVAFLLPYSEAAAAEAFSRLIVSRANTPVVEVRFATYPDPSFDALLADSLAQAEVADVAAYSPSRRQGFSHFFIALAIKLTSPGPVVFRQMRIGKEGKPFPFYKFRSMRCDNDDSVHREYVKSLIEGRHDEVNEGDAYDPVYKLQSDERITGVGRIIRRTSIDELPQLYNVIKGEMSLVGPRPPLAYETENYQSWHMRRLQEVRPGITGLWQVEGRSKTTFDEMVRLDLRYIRNWSLWLDMKILFKTVFVVLRGDGAD
jgi:lipopolysaccharide/colanic/teichoic acid biosynthesis glycosyltransferase